MSQLDPQCTRDVVSVTIFRPRFESLVLWSIGCCSIGIAFYLVFDVVLESPDWVLTTVFGLLSCAMMSGVAIAFAFVEFSDEGISSRFIITRRIRWSEITEWTQWGADGSIFVRTVSGNVFGFSHWCVFGSRSQVVHSLLTEKLGPETKGENAVSFNIMRILFGSMILDGSREEERRNRFTNKN